MKLILSLYSLIVGFLALVIFVLPFAIIASPFKSAQTRLKFLAGPWRFYFLIVTKVACLCKVHVEDYRNEEDKKKVTPKGLYISNHQSFFDIPLSFSQYVIPPIMKKSIVWYPIFGICCYAAGALLVDRTSMNSRRRALEQAKKRLSTGIQALHLYPEGTRNRKSNSPKELKEIKRPILMHAYQEGIPVHTASMYGTFKIIDGYFLNHFQKIGIILRDGIYPKDFDNVDDFIATCWKQVQDDYKTLEGKLS